MIKVVHVVWEDASSTQDWRDKEDFQALIDSDLLLVDSVGMLAAETDKKILLVMSAGNLITGTIQIPRACVRKMDTICTLPISLELE